MPGPAVLYIVAQSIDRGRTGGIASTLGIHTGTLVHITAATVGLSALLVSSALAFSIVKYAGAAYLIYLGARRLLDRDRERPIEARSQRALSRIYAQGVLVNVLNPKTALFFFAFLPQFVDLSRGSASSQIFTLGLLFMLLGLLSDGAYALAAGTAAGWLRRKGGFRRSQRYVTGTVLLGLGAATALSGSRGKV